MNVDSTDYISSDLAIAWYVKKHYPEIIVDFIFPRNVTLERLTANDCNFTIGYDYIDALSESEEQLAAVARAFQHCENVLPSWEVQKATYMKSVYMKSAMALGIP